MIAVDTNILVYAHREDSPFHAEADRVISALAEGSRPWAIPWPCIGEFLSIVTNPRLYAAATPIHLALDEVENWRESPTLTLIAELPGCWTMLRDLVRKSKVTGGAVHDARIAAICLQHEVEQLWSVDRDLSRFSGLQVVNPLIAG